MSFILPPGMSLFSVSISKTGWDRTSEREKRKKKKYILLEYLQVLSRGKCILLFCVYSTLKICDVFGNAKHSCLSSLLNVGAQSKHRQRCCRRYFQVNLLQAFKRLVSCSLVSAQH